MENMYLSGIRVLCNTENEAIKLLSFLDKKGYFWSTGQKLTDVNFWTGRPIAYIISGLGEIVYTRTYESKAISYQIFEEKYIKQINMQERNLKLSLESATELYKTATDEMKTILENTFPELVKSKYPMSHDELQEMIKDKDTCFITTESVVNKAKVWFDASRYHTNRNIILSEKRAKEHLALIQLTALRDKWNEIDEFEPDWSDGNIAKYCISNQEGVTYIDEWWTTSSPLYFRTEETCALFFKTFKDLIEEAKNLI